MKLKYNSSKVDRSKDGDLVPPQPGVYKMKIESCTYEKDKDRIVIVSRMLENDGEGHGKGYGFWDYVPLDLDWKIDNWLQAIGVDTENRPEGEFDPKDFVAKTIMGRVVSDFYTKDGETEPRYSPRLRKPLPMTADDDEEGWDEDSELDEDVEEEEVEAPAELPSKDEVVEMGELADDDDEDAMLGLATVAQGLGIDPDEFATWSELADAIVEKLPKPKPAKKAAAKKAAPAKKTAAKKAAAKPKPEPEPEPEEEEEEEESDSGADDDYDEWTVDELKEELEARELSPRGSKAALIKRLRENDNDPF